MNMPNQDSLFMEFYFIILLSVSLLFQSMIFAETEMEFSEIKPEQILTSGFQIKDFRGNSLSNEIGLGQQIRLTLDLANQNQNQQDFVYLIQIKDGTEKVVSLSWVQGNLLPFQKLSTEQSWVTTTPGNFHATFYVWKSFDDPKSLANPETITMKVSPKINLELDRISGSQLSDLIFSACRNDDDCTIRFLQQLPKENYTLAFETVDSLLNRYEDSDFYCHPVAHHVGEWILGYVGGDITDAINYVDSRCASGVLHGLTENTIPIQMVLMGKSIQDVDIVTPCLIIERNIGHDAQVECIHGMGHSITKAYDYDVISAVEKCDSYQDGNQRYMCQGGLFMENISSFWDDKEGDFDENDFYYPCNKIAEKKAELCYRYQGLYFLKIYKFDEQKAFELCDNIENPNHSGICVKGVATQIATRNFDEIEPTIQMCQKIIENHQRMCILGVVESLTRFVSDQSALEFCQSLSNPLQSSCLERMDQLVDDRF